MGKIEYNVDSFANAIVYAQRFNTNATSAKSQAEGILSGINPPDGLEISSELAQIREQLNNYSTRASEIVASLNSIKGQIEAMDASAAAQIAYMINNNTESINILENIKYGNGTITSYDDLSWDEKFKLWAKDKWGKFSDTARTGAIAVADGVTNCVVIPTAKGINWTVNSLGYKMGFISEEEASKNINRNNNTLNWLGENPYTQKYTDANGKEHYVSYMVDDSWISPDGKVYKGIKDVSGLAGNVVIRYTPAGIPVAIFQAGGYAGDRALSQGYAVDEYTMNYVLTAEVAEIPKAMFDKFVLDKIPQAKGVKGKTINILLGGGTQALEMPIDVGLQYITYNNTKWGTDLKGNPVVVPKSMREVWDENGGFKTWGIDIATGMAFTAGGEAISGIAHYAVDKNLTKQIDSTFEDINQKYGNGVSYYKDRIMQDLDVTLKTSGKTIKDKNDAIKYMDEYMKMDDGSNYFSYLDSKKTVLRYENNDEYIPESFYAFPEIHDKMENLDANSVKINNFTSKYSANKVDLNNNSLIMSDSAFHQLQHVKDTDAAAFNLSIGNGKSINVFQTSSPEHHIIHEGIHDSANKASGTSGLMYWEPDRGINEGATEFIAAEISGKTNQSGYEPIVEVYRAMSDGLNARGLDGVDIIANDYYKGDFMDLEYNFQTVVGEPHNSFDSDTYTKFKEASQTIATKEQHSALDVHNAQRTLKDITNQILDETANYKLQGGN